MSAMLLLLWLKFICFFPLQRPWHFPVMKHEARADLPIAVFLFFSAMAQPKHLPERNQWQSARPPVGSVECQVLPSYRCRARTGVKEITLTCISLSKVQHHFKRILSILADYSFAEESHINADAIWTSWQKGQEAQSASSYTVNVAETFLQDVNHTR